MAGRENIPYINARIRARKSRLLGGAFLRDAAAAASMEGLLKQFGSTPYGSHVVRALVSTDDAALAADHAVTEALAEDAAAVRRFGTDDDPSPYRLLFARWDAWNLKVVLRGLHGRRPPEEILSAALPVGWVRPSVWRELASSTGVTAGLEKAITMEIPAAASLHGLRAGGRGAGIDLSAAEAEVDRWFYGESLSAFGRWKWSGPFWDPVERSLRWEVDARNFSVIVEGYGRDAPPGPERLLAGSRWADRKLLSRLRGARDPFALLAETAERSYPGPDGAKAAEQLRMRHFSSAMGSIERASWRKQMGLLREDPLSTGLLAGYLWARAAEARDLRRVVWGVRFGFPRDLIVEGFLAS